jgi:hypothetical protein
MMRLGKVRLLIRSGSNSIVLPPNISHREKTILRILRPRNICQLGVQKIASFSENIEADGDARIGIQIPASCAYKYITSAEK